MGESDYDKYVSGRGDLSADVEHIYKEKGQELGNRPDWVGAALEESMVPFAMQRMYERRSSQFQEDEAWTVDQGTEEMLSAEYNESDAKYLRESGSKEEFSARREYIREDQQRLQAMGAGGWKGVGAMLGFSLIDPVNIGMSFATGGISALKTGGTVLRATKIGLSSGLENVILDAALMQGNTQSKASDLILSFAAGSVMGAGIGALGRGVDPKLGREVDAANTALRADSENNVVDKILNEATEGQVLPIAKKYPGSDARAIKASIDDYEVKLKKNIGGALHRKTAKKIQGKIKELQRQLDVENTKTKEVQSNLKVEREDIAIKEREAVEKFNKERVKVEERHAAKIEAQRAKIDKIDKKLERKPDDRKQAAKLYKQEVELERLKAAMDEDLKSLKRRVNRKVKRAESKFERLVNKATGKIKARTIKIDSQYIEHQARLNRAIKAKSSALEYKSWQRMSEDEKIALVYKDRELPNAGEELKRQVDTYGHPREAKPEESSIAPVEEAGPGSVGAAGIDDRPIYNVYDIEIKDQQKLAQYAYDGSNVPEDLRGRRLGIRSKFTDMLHSAQTMVSNSKSFTVRGFGWHLFEAPQGGTANKVTVASRVRNFSVQIRSAMRNRLNEGLEEWGKEQGLSKWKTLMNKKNFQSYHKAVMIEVKNPGTYDSPGIIKGAEGVRAQLQMAGDIRKRSGEAGFDNMDLDANYVPIILNEQAIKNALINNPEGRVVDVISLGYQKGKFKLDEELADRLAGAYVTRAKNHTLTMGDAIRQSTDADVEELADQLRKAGVEDDVVEDFLDLSMNKEVRQHMSNRAKKSLHPDIDVEVGGLKFIDFVDSDLPKLLESYTREAAGGGAFAKMGFKTRAQVIDFLRKMEMGATNNGFVPEEIARDMQILRDGVDMAYGRSLNENAHSPFVRNLSRLRDLTGLLRLQFVGAASIPELARVTAQRSLSSVLDSVSEVGAIRGTKNLRSGGKYSGKFSNENLNELEVIMGYVGEDHVLYPNGLRADDLEESAFNSRLGNYFDNAIAQGRRVQEVASGFRTIQGSGEKIAVRSLASDIKKWAVDGGKELSQSNINRAGWSDGFLDEVKKFMKEKPMYDDYKGKKVTLFNFGEMAPEMQERLQIGMHRLVMADMQRPMIGETPMFMHKWLGQSITQFRSFSILSMEKQLVHDFRHDRAMGAVIAMHSLMMSYMAVGVASLQRNIGKDNASERIENDMTGTNAIVDSFNRMGQLAAAGICVDMAATFGLLPDALMGTRDQVGARALTTGSVPVLGLAQDLLQAPKAIADVITGKEDASKALKEIQDVLPFGKAIGVNQALNVIKGSLD